MTADAFPSWRFECTALHRPTPGHLPTESLESQPHWQLEVRRALRACERRPILYFRCVPRSPSMGRYDTFELLAVSPSVVDTLGLPKVEVLRLATGHQRVHHRHLLV